MGLQEFEGIYFEDLAGSARPVRVALTPSALVISYQQQGGTLPVSRYWQAHRIEKHAAAGKAVLHYGRHPVQRLEVGDAAFLPQLEAFYQQQQRQGGPPPAAASPRWLWPAFVLVLALIPAAYFWGLPALADFAARRVPAAYERLLGQQLQQQLVDRRQVDPARTRQLRHFARQLKLKSPYPIDLTVVKQPEPNAFAIPGGFIVVHQGLLDMVQSPEELAALLGHEYGHLQLRHATRALFRSLSGYVFVAWLLGDISGITAVVLENAGSLRALHYSRKLEKEADLLGLQVLRQNKLDPRGMLRLFTHLKAQSKESETEFISSHPLLRNRINYVQALLVKEKPVIAPSDSLQYYWKALKATAR